MIPTLIQQMFYLLWSQLFSNIIRSNIDQVLCHIKIFNPRFFIYPKIKEKKGFTIHNSYLNFSFFVNFLCSKFHQNKKFRKFSKFFFKVQKWTWKIKFEVWNNNKLKNTIARSKCAFYTKTNEILESKQYKFWFIIRAVHIHEVIQWKFILKNSTYYEDIV